MALVCPTNHEADAVNAAMQQRRIDAGELDPSLLALGLGEKRLLEGDQVQTRRNHRRTGVKNRATWIVHGIHTDTIDLVSPTDSGQLRRVTRAYALEHVQLAYASTVHGVQGETTDAAIVGPDADAGRTLCRTDPQPPPQRGDLHCDNGCRRPRQPRGNHVPRNHGALDRRLDASSGR